MNLQLLLPTTYNIIHPIQILMGAQQGDFSQALSDIFILFTLYIALLGIALALIHTLISIFRVQRYLGKLRKVQSFEFARESLLKNSGLPLMKEFDHHLVSIPALDGSEQDELRRSIDAEEIFSEKVFSPGLSTSRLCQALPGLVTGIGVLGTFIGLQLGIGGLDLHDLKQLESSIIPLIQGCAVAFSTSVWGVGLSLFFSISEKSLEELAVRRLNALQNIVNHLVPRYVPEEAMAGLERSSRGTEGLLKGLAVAIGEEMQKAIGRLGTEIKEAVSNATKEGQGPLVEQSAQLLSSAITAELGKLKESVDGMGQRFTEKFSSASDALMRSVQNFEPTVSSLSDVVSHTQSTVNQAVDKLNAHESVVDQLGQAAMQIYHAASNFHEMREVLQYGSQLNREASQAQQQSAALSQEVISKFASVGEALQKVQPVADTLIEAVKTSQTAISNAVTKLTAHELVMEAMGQAAEKIHAAAHEFSSMNETMQNKEAAQTQKEAASLNHEVVDKFDSINEGLKGFEPLVESLSTSVAGSKDIVVSAVEKLNAHGDVMSQMSEAVDKLQLASQSFTSMNTVFEQSIKLSKEAALAQESAASVNQNVATKFASIGENLPEARDAILDAARVIGTLGAPLMSLQDLLAKQPEIQKQIEGQRAASEEERSARLLSLSTDLAKTVETAVIEFSKVGAVAEQLGDVSDRLESASESLAEFGKHVQQATKDQKEASQASLTAASSNERVAKILEPIPEGITQLTSGLQLAGEKVREGAESSAESFRMLIQYQERWHEGVTNGLHVLKDRVQDIITSYGGQIEGQTQSLITKWTEEVIKSLKLYETQISTLEGSLDDLQRAITQLKTRN